MSDISTNTLKIGTVLNDNWVILEFIDKGGMGEVYRAHQVNLKRDVAIKVISRKWLESCDDNAQERETGLERFRREVEAMARVRNPLRSKIVKSAADSGFDHLTARVDPNLYERQVRLFHDIFGFERLGIVYEQDTATGRGYAALDAVEKVAAERGFKIVSCNAPASRVSKEAAKQAALTCYRELASRVDAVYITVHRGVTLRKLCKILEPLHRRNLPTFSQRGPHEVRYGVLMSLAEADFKYIAPFHAQKIAKIVNGAKPRDLGQLHETPPRIALNLEAARMIGYEPNPETLNSADEVYPEIESAYSPARR